MQKLRIYAIPFFMLAAVTVLSGYKFPGKKNSEDFIAELQGNLRKAENSIEVVKKRLLILDQKESRPDLYMQMAELHLERAKYYYFIAREQKPTQIKGPSDVPEAVKEKENAIDVYQRVLQEHPNYFNADKVLFFMAQELGQLDREKEEVEQYTKLVRNHPKSEFRNDALLILGNKEFDAKRLNEAMSYYNKILQTPSGSLHNVARYKLAWCEMNQANCDRALKLFEDVARNEMKNDDKKNRSDLRRDSLVDSVLCYSKVKKPEDAVDYYHELADSNVTYVSVLDKLANRYYIQEQWKAAVTIYRELIRHNVNLESQIDYLQRIFGNLRRINYEGPVDEDSKILVEAARRYRFSWRFTEEDRRDALITLEKYMRDAATRLQLQAQEKKDPALQVKVSKIYKSYLQVFEKTQPAQKMKVNAAESYFDAGEYLEAAELYLGLSNTSNTQKDKLQWIHSAVASYFEALKNKDKLSKIELIQARSGFLQNAEKFLQLDSTSDRAGDIKYTIASTYYDQNDWGRAIEEFRAFLSKYPNHSKGSEAVRLLLDSYRMKDDIPAMVQAGKKILNSGQFQGAPFLAEVRDIISKAEFKNIESSTGGKADTANVAGEFFKLSREYRGTEAGEKALYNAFVSAKKADQPGQMIASAEQLRKDYPKSKLLEQVLPLSTQILFQIGLFADGASAAENFEAMFPNNEAVPDLLFHAAKARASMRQYDYAAQNFQQAVRKADQEKRQKIVESYALSMSQAEEWPQLLKAATTWKSIDPSDARAYVFTARALYRMGNLNEAQSAAQEARARLSRGSGGAEQTDMVAEIAFIETAPTYQRYERTTLSGEGGRSEAKIVELKSQLLAKLEKSYTQIANLGSGIWTIASLVKVAHAYEDFGKFLSSTSIPSGLSADQSSQYRAALGEKVSETQQSAKSLYAACQKKVYQIHLYTHDALECVYERPLPRPASKGSGNALSNSDSNVQASIKSLMRNPKDVSSLNLLARSYIRSGGYSLALLILSRALEVDAKNGETSYLLGVAFQNMNKDEEAYAHYIKSLQMNPGLSEARSSLSALCQKYRDPSCSR